MAVNGEVKLLRKIKKKKSGGRSRVRGSDWGGACQGGWERRIEAFVKIPKKNLFFFWGGEASGWGVRVDVNGEVKFL